MKFNMRPPCKTCPFRKTSIQGYLGPETCDSILRVAHGEFGWSCHESIAGKPTQQDGTVDTRKYGTACTGAIISATLSFKAYRGGAIRRLQEQMEGHAATPEIMDAWEFREYHEGTPNPRKKKRLAK